MAGLACKCHEKTCTGEVVTCRDGALNRFCLVPDLSFEACRQGKGNCDGYVGLI